MVKIKEIQGYKHGYNYRFARQDSGLSEAFERIYKPQKKKRNKFNSSRITIDGIEFHSKLEARRYLELKAMQEKGLITNLELQPKLTIQDKFEYRGENIRAIYYIGDFKYGKDNEIIIEDVKGVGLKNKNNGTATNVFTIKWKLVKKKFGHIYNFNIVTTKEVNYSTRDLMIYYTSQNNLREVKKDDF